MRKTLFGICDWVFPVQGPYIVKMASQLGFDGVELDLGAYEHNFPLSNKTIQQEYMDEAQRWGMSFSALAVNALCEYGMKNPKGSVKSEIADMAIEKAINAACSMEIDIVQLPSFEDGYINTEEEFLSLEECLRNACRYARDKDICIATENVLSVEENLRLINEVNMPNLKIYLDTQNPYLRKGYYVPDMIRAFGDLIIQVHVKDGSNGQLSAALLGKGDTDFYESIKALKEINYSGWIVLENFYDQKPMNNGDADPFKLITEDYNILKKAIDSN